MNEMEKSGKKRTTCMVFICLGTFSINAQVLFAGILFQRTNMMTSDFLKLWVAHGLEDDTTVEAKILEEYGAKEKAKKRYIIRILENIKTG